MDYIKHYNLLIEKAKKRKRQEGTYYETHHILPRSEGGTDEDANLVRLTGREHYIAHYLLWMDAKINNLPAIESRARAFWFMCQDIKRRVYTVPSRVYEAARIAVSESNKTGEVVECEMCGKHFYRQKHAIRSKIFCSRKCFSLSAKPVPERVGWSEESRLNASKRREGMTVVNNGEVNKYIQVEELSRMLEEGWIKGPKKRERMEWYNNGEKESYIRISNEIPEGWKRGRLIEGTTKGKKAISKDGKVKYVSNPEEWITQGWKLGNEKYYPGYLHSPRIKKNK